MAIQSNLAEARKSVERSGLKDEEKAGLYVTIDGLINAFSVGGMQSAIANHLPNFDQSLTIFAFVTGGLQLDVPEGFVEERDALIDDLNLFIGELDKLDVDERLREVARSQISLLIALLRSAEAIGVEAALAAYYEMLIKLRSRSASTEKDDPEDKSKFWSNIKSWSERLDSLSKIYDMGQRLLPFVEKIPQITGFL